MIIIDSFKHNHYDIIIIFTVKFFPRNALLFLKQSRAVMHAPCGLYLSQSKYPGLDRYLGKPAYTPTSLPYSHKENSLHISQLLFDHQNCK
jgi:hypothetical protein